MHSGFGMSAFPAHSIAARSRQQRFEFIMTAPSPVRHFTIEQANRMLPLVRTIVSDIVSLANDLTQRTDRLSFLQSADREAGDPYSEEVLQMQDEVEADMDRLQAYVDELSELGVELRSATEGLVDFRTVMEGHEACLCWKLGEEEIGFWHEMSAG
jgi:hypothetical protein